MARQTFYFSDGPYLQAMQGLHAALSGSEAFVKFIGQPRTGKSGVCEKLTQFMRLKDYRVIYFDYPIESPDMLRSMLAKELEIPDSFNIMRHLEDALAAEAEKPLVIIFDDAHLVSDITLIEIYRLAGVQVQQKRVINIVLCGEPELERRLNSKKEFKSLLQHVSHNFLLEPMDAVGTSNFLLAFLEKMGLPGLQLEPAAQNQFYKSCKGFPGPAYSLCQLVLSLRQGSEELQPVTREELLRAISSVDSEQPVPSSLLREGNRWMLFGPVAAVVVIASLALLVRQLNPQQQEGEFEETLSLAVEAQTEPATTAVPASPFAVDEIGLSNSAGSSAADDSAQPEASPAQSVEALAEELVAGEEELPVSDSSLALVTAQERGISHEIITEPLFEQMQSDTDAADDSPQPALSLIDESVPDGDVADLASVTLTRPMLALDDEEIEIPAEEIEVEATRYVAQAVAEVATPESAPEESVLEDSSSPSPQQVVQDWLDAWEGQNLERYFASYDEGFVPRYHRSKAAWLSNRERVISNASQISLEMSDFVLIGEDAETIEVHFWLAYRSPSYRDNTRKKLILKKSPPDDRGEVALLILEEINLEVRV